MIDAGAGNTMQPTLGKLPDNLRAAGVEPGAVTHIVMTHLHPDHANGLVDDAGNPHYPQADSKPRAELLASAVGTVSRDAFLELGGRLPLLPGTSKK